MKICMISSECLPTPPVGYWGGIEAMTWDLSCKLVEMGHDVTLIGRPGSKAPFGNKNQGKLIETFPDVPDVLGINERHFNCYRDFVSKFDGIVHDNTIGKLVRTIASRYIQTPHFCQHPHDMGYRNIVAASRAQSAWLEQRLDKRRSIPSIHHGIDSKRFTFSKDKEDFYLYFSVVAKYKGALDALQIAKETGVKIVFAGRDGDMSGEIKNCNLDNVTYMGQVSNEKRSELMSRAKALIFPTGGLIERFDWMEIFGLVQLEAFASGTPVICSNNGACPEVIKHGITGFVCNDYASMKNVVKENLVSSINPATCRRETEKGSEFSSDNMAEEYIKLYKRRMKGKEI